MKVQDQAIPVCQERSQWGKRLAWLSKGLSQELGKKRGLKKEWTTQEMFKDVTRSCRKKIREVEALLEVNLATSVKDNKCFIHVNKKRTKKKPFILYCMLGSENSYQR